MPTIRQHGAELFYEVHGETGEPVLMIQGVGVIGHGWRPQVDDLAKDHRLLTFDSRGIGRSTMESGARFSIEEMADDAAALAAAVGWESYHVVGHSMGGVIAQHLARQRPARIRSLSLLCTVARGADAVRFNARQCWVMLRTSLGPRKWRRRAFLELIYPPSYLATADVVALAAEGAELFGHDLAVQPPIAIKQAMALRRYDGRAGLRELGIVPTQVVSSTFDPIAEPRFGRELADLIPGARFIEITDASHGVPIQQPAVINRLLREHVSKARLTNRL